ncbi:protein MAIN-LIKE 1 [Lathyrus oleraceus]|uniref:protein MAIN-LIKE 1 n=1 Tax=Pisum sativum TaxID=3888 RepID=UPI0021D3D0D7|nr:protein MAIN-LIKE 1-like [Pisum sativum]
MESWLSRSGLASLQRTSLNKIDTNLVSAFVERWHLETSSFHMPFGEMSITLDDVACLLHLPIRGIFWSPQDVTEELAVELAVDYLGVSQGQAQSHVRSCRGSYYKLEWLYDIFVHHRAASSWAYATRCWTHEYFPIVGKRGENWNPAGNCGLPRAMRCYHQSVADVIGSSTVATTPSEVEDGYLEWCK